MLIRPVTFHLLWSVLPIVFGHFEDRQWLYFGEPDIIGQQNGTCENLIVLASEKFPLPFSPNLTSTCTSSGGPIRLIFGEDVWSGERVSNISVRFDCDSSFTLLRNYSLIHRDGFAMPGNTSASIACDLVGSIKPNTTHVSSPSLHPNGTVGLPGSTGQGSAVIAAPSQSESAIGTDQGLNLPDDGVPQHGSDASSQETGSTSGEITMPTAGNTNGSQEDDSKTEPTLEGPSTHPSDSQQLPQSGIISSANSAIPTLPASPSGDAVPDQTAGGAPSITNQTDLPTTTDSSTGTEPSGVTSLSQSSQPFQDPAYGMTASRPEDPLPTQDNACTCRSG